MTTTRHAGTRLWRALALGTTFFVGCGPIVSIESNDDATASANAVGASTSGPEGPDATPVDPGCTPGERTPCTCAGVEAGSAVCEADGALGSCDCDDAGSTGGGTSTGFGASEESGWVGSGSSEGGSSSTTTSGGPTQCLPLDEPCPGDVVVQTNAEVEAVAACSRIEGTLEIRGGVTDLSPLTCLRELGNQLFVESIDIPSLAALSNLQHIEGELEILYTRMTSLGLPALETATYFSLYQNNEMLSLDVPNLTTISGGLDVHDNVLLSTCEVASLAEEAVPAGQTAFYDGNADDCPSSE